MVKIGLQRLYNQHLAGNPLPTAVEVVRWFGAVQGQEYPFAKWALGMRLPAGVTEKDIEAVFTSGDLLRTHAMRPTWHFLTPDDFRWIVELTAPRVKQLNAYMDKKLELDEAVFARTNDVMINALRGGKHLMREEIGTALAEAGIEAKGMRLAYIIMRAELDAIICSGARRGKQFTYALVDERAPNAKSLPREEALAQITRRYFASHGPAMPKEFAWWSGLTVADAKAGISLNQPYLVKEIIDGSEYWYASDMPIMTETEPHAHLLPQLDEFTVGYRESGGILLPEYLERIKVAMAANKELEMGIYWGMILVNCQIIGTWRRTFEKKSVVIEASPFRPFSADEKALYEAAAQRFADFVQMPPVIEYRKSIS
jgi:hypothetical protein